MELFQAAKLALIELTSFSKDALHIYVALAIYCGSCWLMRWKVGEWKPWVLVLGAALLGEFWDVRFSISDNDPLHPWRNAKDVLNTMIAPTLLGLAARYTRIFDTMPDAGEISGDEP